MAFSLSSPTYSMPPFIQLPTPSPPDIRTTPIKMDPWAISETASGVAFDHSGYDGIKSIVITSGIGIDAMKVQYLRGDEEVWVDKVGGPGGGKTTTITLQHPLEYLVAMKGHHGAKVGGHHILGSLTLISNLKTYGPIGDGAGFPFEISTMGQRAKIVGFHGKARPYVSQLGVYVLPLSTNTFEARIKALLNPLQESMVTLEQAFDKIFIPTTPFGVVSKFLSKKSIAEKDSQTRIRELLLDMKNSIANIEKELHKIQELDLDVKGNVHHHEGPWGGKDGEAWDDGCFQGIRHVIFATMDNTLTSIHPIYHMNGLSHPSLRRGNPANIHDSMIEFKYPEERLERISGFIHPWKEDPAVVAVKSLTFHTNKGKYGPFGEEIGEAFSSTAYKGEIIGFFGRSTGAYINAIGVHIKCFHA